MSESTPASSADLAADRVLDKLRVFVASLDDDERAVLAALLAPGVASAYTDPADAEQQEVVGFGLTTWAPENLPDSLSARVRTKRVRVEFDGEAPPSRS